MDASVKISVGRGGKTPVGEGRIRLLRLIEETGSLRKAAEGMGMSYRHAWGIIRHLEEELGGSLVVSTRGGKGGGKTVITDLASELISEYESLKKTVDEALVGRLI